MPREMKTANRSRKLQSRIGLLFFSAGTKYLWIEEDEIGRITAEICRLGSVWNIPFQAV